jgi:hypothetical protein
LQEEEVNGNFAWAKTSGDLTAVKVLASDPKTKTYVSGDTVIVISTMIQEFEYKKNKFKICPSTAVIGQIHEE